MLESAYSVCDKRRYIIAFHHRYDKLCRNFTMLIFMKT